MAEPSVTAIGRLAPASAWVGFERTDDGYQLIFGEEDGSLRRSERGPRLHDDLLVAALAYFEESFGDAPPELEATQADIAGLVRWLAAGEEDAQRREMLRLAVDAIDDGLAPEAVSSALSRAARHGAEGATGQADPADLLVERYRAAGG